MNRSLTRIAVAAIAILAYEVDQRREFLVDLARHLEASSGQIHTLHLGKLRQLLSSLERQGFEGDVLALD
ncbi:hypothetical protein P5X00_39785 (plasmid) [Paraburkholderia sp. A2RO-4L]|uniref:hypothetical protein n=1 Tax=Paraburkholderia sp. A2RO-4L TaxID=3028374 RepID=UPI003DA9D033